MADMENDYTEEKGLSDYAKQRAKHKEEIDNLTAQLNAEKMGRIQDKKLYFWKTLESQGYAGDFTEFADKYAETLSLDEMVSLFRWMNGVAQTENKPESTGETTTAQTTLWPKSVIGTNPTNWTGAKSLDEMTLEELQQFWKANMHMFK